MNIHESIENIKKGRDLDKNLPYFATAMSDSFLVHGANELSFNFVMLYQSVEALEDNKNEKKLLSELNDIVKKGILSEFDGAKREDCVKKALELRNVVEDRHDKLSVIMSYFDLYRYILTRKVKREEIQAEPDDAARKVLRYIFDTNDNNVIKTALSNTFYSTNISFEYYLKGSLSTELQKTFDFKIDKEAAHIVASVGGSTSNVYFRVTTDGKDQYYMEGMTDGFVDVNNPNLYCTLPFPSLECIANNYYAIRDDDIGGFAALIVSDLSRVEYNEESGFYSISHITASQTGFDYKGYIVEAGESDFSVSFKLSEDQKYISTLNGTVHHSSIGGRDGDEFKMEFNSFHQTVVVLPE